MFLDVTLHTIQSFLDGIYQWWTLLTPLRNICVTNENGYVPFVVITIRFFPHSWLINGFVTRVTRRVPLVEQELCLLSRDTWHYPRDVSDVRVPRSLIFCVVFCGSLFILKLSFFFLPLCFLFFDLRFHITSFVSSNFSWHFAWLKEIWSKFLLNANWH